MKHFLLFYELVEDYSARRGEFRDAHLALAWEACERGEMVLAGAIAEPLDTAMLLFQGETSEAAERFAASDPYVQHGLIKRWYIREWMTAVGDAAAAPVRPASR